MAYLKTGFSVKIGNVGRMPVPFILVVEYSKRGTGRTAGVDSMIFLIPKYRRPKIIVMITDNILVYDREILQRGVVGELFIKGCAFYCMLQEFDKTFVPFILGFDRIKIF